MAGYTSAAQKKVFVWTFRRTDSHVTRNPGAVTGMAEGRTVRINTKLQSRKDRNEPEFLGSFLKEGRDPKDYATPTEFFIGAGWAWLQIFHS